MYEHHVNKINKAATWPVGSAMCYQVMSSSKDGEYIRFYAVGLVVGNVDGELMVMWPEHCRERLKTYNVLTLNPWVISRLW